MVVDGFLDDKSLEQTAPDGRKYTNFDDIIKRDYGCVEVLHAECEASRLDEWAKTLRAYLEDPKDFYNAYWFLAEHPANNQSDYGDFEMNYDIHVAKVDPVTRTVEDNKERNTKVEVWIEWGPWYEPPIKDMPEMINGCRSHDYRVDTGGATFEEAIINLAHNVWFLYRDQKAISNKAKLKKKDRW